MGDAAFQLQIDFSFQSLVEKLCAKQKAVGLARSGGESDSSGSGEPTLLAHDEERDGPDEV